jgi:hypothetical protein
MFLRKLLLTALCVVFAAAPVMASRAEIDGRGLPRRLALDETLLRLFPGSARLFVPQISLDYISDPSSFSQPSVSDRFAMAMIGEKTKLGAGYQWKSLILDVQVRESINLDSPFIRWAATVVL